MTDKHTAPTKLFWVDLEMTGLDPLNDVILEIAAQITDFDFRPLATYEARIKHEPKLVLDRMKKNEWWDSFPDNRDDFIKGLSSGKSLEDVEADLVKLIETQFGGEPAVLAGNSIHCDRGFMKHWWPMLDSRLHYRMLDVSSLKIYMQGKYGLEFKKKEIHRAMGDIQESMAEWQYYIKWLSESSPDKK